MSVTNDLERQLEAFRNDFESLGREIGKVIVGHEQVIEGVLSALATGGHVLLEGLPGTGKTVLVRTLAEVLDLSFQRIQCTPDLTATDVTGTYVIMETPQGRRTFEFQKGPLFANLVLADQINRALPKTQSALLEAMEQSAITVSTEVFELPSPYFLIATQNPMEMEGTYPLPEAQIDRFMFKLVLQPPSMEQIETILDRTTEEEEVIIKKIADDERILEMGELVRKVAIAEEVRRFAVAVVAATHPDFDLAPEYVKRYVRYGSSPRGAQAMVLGAKIQAVLDGRYSASVDDLRAVAYPALRHRVFLNFEGQAENIQTDDVIRSVVESVPGHGGPVASDA
jgi:MoxR-like ATPase